MQSIERDNASADIMAPRPLSAKPTSLPHDSQRDNVQKWDDAAATIPSGGLAGTDAPIIRLSLREIVQRAVANSSDVRVAGYDPAINAQKVIQAEGVFDPNFVTNVNIERQDTQIKRYADYDWCCPCRWRKSNAGHCDPRLQQTERLYV